MRRLFLLLLLFSVNISIADNTIVAIVNEDVITLDSIEWQLNVASSYDEKIDIVSRQVDLLLQLDVAKKLGIEPQNEEVEGALMQFLATHDFLAAIMLLMAGVSVILGHLRGLGSLLSYSASETSEWSVGEQPVTIICSGAGALAVLTVGVFPQWVLPAVTRTVDVLVLLIG